MTWRTANNSEQNYSFTYDGANRMLDAIYSEGVSSSQNLNRYTEKVTEYDKNGNIKKLQRYGQTGASSYGLVDNLTYTYNGNKLTRVDDAVTATSYTGGTNFVNGASTNNEYTYDANGNLTKDSNKGIANITYNLLSLPQVVTFSDGSTIRYMYSADGTKLKTTHVINGTTTTTDYCGNVIYENGTAKRLLNDEGYVDLSNNTYYYYLKDHQGNNRVVISTDGTVQETNHYYPFGGLFSTSTNVQPYKYNGKELDTKKGLNLYDYGARHYDAALGRWHVVDPLAEKYGALSPYGYCANNPIKFSDLDGRKIVVGSPIGRFLAFLGVDNYESKVQRDIAQLKKDDPDVAKMIERLEKSEYVIEIGQVDLNINESGGNYTLPKHRNLEIKQGSTIGYNPENTTTNQGNTREPRVGLAHELGHADDLAQGKGVNFDSKEAKNGNLKEQQKGINNERNAIEMENKVRESLNLELRNVEDYYKIKQK